MIKYLIFFCRIGVNIAVALMLGVLYIGAGNEGSRVLDNYNLLFAILMHSSMATMMLTVLTCKLNTLRMLHACKWENSISIFFFILIM